VTDLRIGDQLIRFDRDVTVAAYLQVPHGQANDCPCSGCRNFALLREKIYPTEFRNLLDTIGIDGNKEGEAVHYGPVEGSLHFYGGWFYFVGEVAEKGERLVEIGNLEARGFKDVKTMTGHDAHGEFQYFCSWIFPRPPAIFGSQVATLEFATRLPWVLDTPYDPVAEAQILKCEER